MNDTTMTTASSAPARRVLVWDAPVRLFHWLMVGSFIGAYLTGESERFRLLHVTLGYTMAGLLVFRIVWGLVGTRHALFSDFVRGPRAAWRYVTSLLHGKPEHHVGHNPAGAIAIVGLLVLTALTALTGWASYQELGGEWLEALHEGLANAMLALVFVHVAGVVVGSFVHHENLVASMVTGRKHATPDEGIGHAWRSLAALMLVVVLGFWWVQWIGAPAAPLRDGRASAVEPGGKAVSHERRERHRDKD